MRVATPTAPFIVSVPFVAGATEVQLVRGGKIIARQSIVPELLRTALRMLPAAAFAGTPGRRAAMADKIEALASALATGDGRVARRPLLHELRRHATALTDVPVGSPLMTTRAALLTLIDNLAPRM
jgi:hypothetical protein